MSLDEKIAKCKSLGLPLPMQQCQGCGKIIYRLDNRYQCPNCGGVSTPFRGFYYLSPDGKKFTPDQEWRELCDQSKIIMDS